MKTKLTLALVASLTSTAFAAFQAPLPEFKNEKQLAEWRAEKADEAASQGYAAEETAFYTGKPYLASSGSYAFKYRSYSPELARWSSEDPSGFPDGPNNFFYAPRPTNEMDPFGLAKTVTVTGIPEMGEDGSNFSIVTTLYPQQVNEAIQGTMAVNWSVTTGLKGYVVQYLQFEENVRNDDGSPWTPTDPWTPFWEAFRIDGQNSINSDTYLTDNYSQTTSGSFKVIGKVDFYQDSQFTSTNSPSTWSTNNPKTGGLPSINTQPSWWTGTGFNHNLTMTWE
jgi:RHS repeat-associated protein